MDSIACLKCRERVAYRRGNCMLCHGRNVKAVRQGKTTWAELVTRGLALPAKHRGQNWMPDHPRRPADRRKENGRPRTLGGQPGKGSYHGPKAGGDLTMAESPKEPDARSEKKKTVRCEGICAYVSGGKEPRRCKNRCGQEKGHVLSCKCRTHQMQ